MRIITTLLVSLGIVLIGAIGFIYSGFYNVGATSPHSRIARWVMSTTMHASVERRANDIEVPELTETMRLAGANDFSIMCAGCHGAPGKEPEAMGHGLNPPAPDLAESAEHASAAELFWVTKNGIKMTAMPAWGVTHDDTSLWPVVAFMTTLPDLDAKSYQSLISSSEGMGHHDANGNNGNASEESAHGDHDHGATSQVIPVAPSAHEERAADDHGHKNNGHSH